MQLKKKQHRTSSPALQYFPTPSLRFSSFLPLVDRSFQDEFDLAIDAPELFLSPRFQLAPKLVVDSQ